MPPETVVLRYVFRGRIWAATPLLLVEERDGMLVLWLPEGTWRQGPRTPGRDRAVPTEWEISPKRWHEPGALVLVRPEDAHSIWIFWRGDWEHRSWYVNLQEPLRRTALGYDTMDQALDVIVGPDRSWQWKDEHELAEQVELGVFSEAEAASIRREGERVIAAVEANAPPFCDGWERWRPDPSWPLPELPEGWDVV